MARNSNNLIATWWRRREEYDDKIFNFSHRWHNHLDPSINKKQWSDYEEMQFIQAH